MSRSLERFLRERLLGRKPIRRAAGKGGSGWITNPPQLATCPTSTWKVNQSPSSVPGENLAESIARSGEIRKPHFHVFARQDRAVGSSLERGADGAANVIRLGPLVGLASGHVDIDAGVEFHVGSAARTRAFYLARKIIGRESARVERLVRTFLVVHHFVIEL